MYIARRPFRNYGQMVLPGSTVEPDSTKWFKTRLKDKTIVEVDAHNFKQWKSYFKDKFGVDLNDPAEESKEAHAEESKEAHAEESKEVPKKRVVTVKV